MMTTLTARRLSVILLGSAASLAMTPSALAQETISDDRTTPVVTSDVAGDTTLESGGSISLNGGTALTIDSDEVVIVDGDIVFDADAPSDNSTGILITGNRAVDYTQNGSILLLDSLERDGITAPDFADSRFGFWLGAGTHTGSITLGNTAEIDVDGDSSAAFRLEGDLTGDVIIDGTLGVEGAGSTAIDISGGVIGNVTVEGTSNVSAFGENSDGINISGDIDGALALNGSVSVTAFQDATPETVPVPVDNDGDGSIDNQTDIDDAEAINAVQAALQSGHGIVISSIVTGGVLLDGPLPSEFSDVEGQSTTTAAVEVRGSGNALRVDGATLGFVDTTGITDYGNYGLINRGDLAARGTYEGVAAETVNVRNSDVSGGIRNDNEIIASATGASATAVTLGTGLTTPEFYNRGLLQAIATGFGAETIAIDIEAGADVPTLVNVGVIEALGISDDSDVIAVRDASGSVTSFTNSGSIIADLRDDDDNNALTTDDENEPTGRELALDFSANTVGITITNTVRDDFDSETDDRNLFGTVFGNVLTGSGDDVYSLDAGNTFGDLFLGGGADTVAASMGADIFGDIDFGTGNDALSLDGGNVVGDLFFGAGTSTISLTNESTFVGDIFNTGTLNIDVDNSDLTLNIGTDVALNDFTTTNGANLGFAISGDGTSAAQISALTANLSADTTITTLFTGAFNTAEQSFTLVSSGALTLGGNAADLLTTEEGVLPILFEQTLSTENSGNDLVLTLRRRTPDELEIGTNLQPAFSPVIDALTEDDELGALLFNATTTDEFNDIFNQAIAGPLDAPLAYARAQNSSVTSLVTQRVDELTQDETRPGHIWLQEEGYFINRDEDENSNGYDGGGFVVAAGIDMPLAGIDVVGVSAHFASARYDEQAGEDFPFDRTTIGADLYYAERLGQFDIDGRVGYAFASSSSERNVNFGGGLRQVTADWDGTQVTANSRIRYRMDMGKTQLTPFTSIDYVSISEDGYTETGDETLALTVSDIDGDSLRANVGFSISRAFKGRSGNFEFSRPGVFTPRLTAAWSQELITDDLEATYNFDGGTPFTLISEPESSAAILGGDLTYENEYATVHLGMSGTFGETTELFTLRAGVGLKW